VQKEAGETLVKTQEEMKRQVDKERKEAKVWKVGDNIVTNQRP